MKLFKKERFVLLKNSLRKFGASLVKTKKRRIVVFVVGPLLLLIIYLLISFLRVSKYEVALVELDDSFSPSIICHEKCTLFRQTRELILINGLKNNNKRAVRVIADYWQDQAISLELKRELIKVLQLAYGTSSPPLYLKNYLITSDAEPGLIGEIIFRFPLLITNNQSFKNMLTQRIINATTLEEKIEFLQILREISNDAEIINYFTILLTDNELELKQEALKNISNIKDKRSYFDLDQLTIIRNLIFDISTDQALRRNLVLLIGDYYLVYPEASAALWREIYIDNSLDSISRLFSADSLNHLEKINLILPYVDADEWDKYYNS